VQGDTNRKILAHIASRREFQLKKDLGGLKRLKRLNITERLKKAGGATEKIKPGTSEQNPEK